MSSADAASAVGTTNARISAWICVTDSDALPFVRVSSATAPPTSSNDAWACLANGRTLPSELASSDVSKLPARAVAVRTSVAFAASSTPGP